jgi:hypothetical protein
MITLLLGAGASQKAGYPLASQLISAWEDIQKNVLAISEAYSRLGLNEEIQIKCREYLNAGLNILKEKNCRTPDEFATRFPKEKEKLLTLKQGLAALFWVYDGRTTGDNLREYKAMWANILSRQWATDRERSLENILGTTRYRVLTYNYDPAILIAAHSFISEQFHKISPEELKTILQLDSDVSEPSFHNALFSLTHLHGSFAFKIDTPNDINSKIQLSVSTPHKDNIEAICSCPCIHFPSEISRVPSPKEYVEAYAKRARTKLQLVAQHTKVLVVIGFSLHIENWPYFMQFIQSTQRESHLTIALVCPKEFQEALESKIHMLLGEAERPHSKVIHLAQSFETFLNLPQVRDEVSL